MKIKICGLKYPDNILEIAQLQPDYMGFIFHKKSVRYVQPADIRETLHQLPHNIMTTGVFVDEALHDVIAIVQLLQLKAVQLHGSESAAYCAQLQKLNIHVIKAFALDDNFDFIKLQEFLPHCDQFLFDARGPLPGGNGIVFDWNILFRYHLQKTFILSGGIGTHQITHIKTLVHPGLSGVDINSRVEISPGLKKLDLTSDIINQIRN